MVCHSKTRILPPKEAKWLALVPWLEWSGVQTVKGLRIHTPWPLGRVTSHREGEEEGRRFQKYLGLLSDSRCGEDGDK